MLLIYRRGNVAVPYLVKEPFIQGKGLAKFAKDRFLAFVYFDLLVRKERVINHLVAVVILNLCEGMVIR